MLKKNESYQIIWLVRRLFRALSHKSNEMLLRFDISAADRAVMEFLYPDKKLSVPEIAERYQVSRQHIQTTVNSLLAKKLLVTEPNPRHKRSVLLQLNASAIALFDNIMQQDQDAIKTLFAGISRNDIRTTQHTLETLLEKLQA